MSSWIKLEIHSFPLYSNLLGCSSNYNPNLKICIIESILNFHYLWDSVASLMNIWACVTSSHFTHTQCVQGSDCKGMCKVWGWPLLGTVCLLHRNGVHAPPFQNSPWRGSGSWPALRRNPPRWLSEGQRRSSSLCSRTASACSCACWTAFHTAPENVWRSRDKKGSQGKWKMQWLKPRQHEKGHRHLQ